MPRWLEIGPGYHGERIPGFETLDVVKRDNVDHIGDASDPLPFDSDTFDLIYASHIIEHIPWQNTERTLKEWVRVLKPGGWLEIWVPDILKICKAYVDAEEGKLKRIEEKGNAKAWRSVGKDPCRWLNGRIFSFTGYLYPPSGFHKAVFSRRFLRKLLQESGLSKITDMERGEIRGTDYGWVNMGVKGQKPV